MFWLSRDTFQLPRDASQQESSQEIQASCPICEGEIVDAEELERRAFLEECRKADEVTDRMIRLYFS